MSGDVLSSSFLGDPQDGGLVDAEQVTFTATMPRWQARALAQLCKRIGWSDCRTLSVDADECQQMINATDQVRAALERAGVYVR